MFIIYFYKWVYQYNGSLSCGLFYTADSISTCMAPNGRMNSHLKRGNGLMEAQSFNLPGEIKKKCEVPEDGWCSSTSLELYY
jgi:hypothetical protein